MTLRGYKAGLEPFRPILEAADSVVVNLETPLTTRNVSPFVNLRPYLHRGDPEKTIEALRSAKIRCVTLANNHFIDYGAGGASDTLKALETAGLSFIGAGCNSVAASRPLVVTKPHSRDIVIFNGFAYYQDFDENFAAYADQERPGTNQLDKARITADIAATRQHSPTALIIVVAHWRRDYKWASQRQRALATAAIEAGCDLVLGHGSHMMQEIDIISGRPVVHGLGNFVFNSPGRYAKHGVPPFSLLAEITIVAASASPIVLRLYPIVTDNKKTDYRPRYVTDREFTKVMDLQRNRSNLGERFDEIVSNGRDEFGLFLEYRFTTPAFDDCRSKAHDRPAAIL